MIQPGLEPGSGAVCGFYLLNQPGDHVCSCQFHAQSHVASDLSASDRRRSGPTKTSARDEHSSRGNGTIPAVPLVPSTLLLILRED
jgi:hypothetical protein